MRRQVGATAGEVDRVVLANVASPGNIARLATLGAGLAPSVPATTINEQCSGGLAAIRLAAEALWSGAAAAVIAGGTESVSQSTVRLEGDPARRAPTSTARRTAHAPPGFDDPEMGLAADAVAAELHISRNRQDEFAALSYARAVSAATSGFFESLIEPIGEPPVARDDSPRRAIARDRLTRYPAAFGPNGTVTAGNAAAVGDGAATVLVSGRPSGAACARIVASAVAAADPGLPALAVVPAIEAVLARAGLPAGAIERWEINEAFAVKVVACIDHFGLDVGRVNPNGGAIAFGHPFSASGAVLVVHLVEELRRSKSRLGVAAIAGAGGLAEAMVFEYTGGGQ